jgi:CrcB protein
MTAPAPPPSLRTELLELGLVALGAVPGALLRWQLSQDLLANVIGSALLGVLVAMPLRPARQLLLGIGFCGSLTTFSGWMVESVQLIAAGRPVAAGALVGGSLLLGLAAAALGFGAGRALVLRQR